MKPINLNQITIRPYRETDITFLYEAARESIEQVSPYLTWGHPNYLKKDAKAWVLSRRQAWVEKKEYSFVITTPEELFLGGIDIQGIDWQNCNANLGYWVRKSALGQGVGVVAAQLAAQFSFDELGLNRLEIVTEMTNRASQRVAEKLGAKNKGLVVNSLSSQAREKQALLYWLTPENLNNLTVKLRKVELVSYDPIWQLQFQQEVKCIQAIFAEVLLEIHHIGSTAIPNMMAKPIIDILAIVSDLPQIDALNPVMAEFGYIAHGELTIPNRRFFTKDSRGKRLVHLHTFAQYNAEIERHLNFRDYLMTHSQEAEAYQQLKLALASQFCYDPNLYACAKNWFIRAIDRKASIWKRK
ncbi:MAG: GrpB domain, predicted nucleotidyltransferase, family [Gammaproteobacteria bacterium]|jgi:GrpB-like predicted nucleotidyltransferase (UPF0157 family)/RimJ/RimL family protein N-acetyltransferase|nr:GrpB domain, predicted nucleotidyltransferase, family [Gammaproteobacteria bacterium]